MQTTTYTKQTLITALKNIRNMEWVASKRNASNSGAIGNTLEDLLGIAENNLPLPNASEWELKTQRRNTSSLLTLFHMEPSPRALKIVNYLLKHYGWKHEEAGKKYPLTEKSFRQTISYHNSTSRGFCLDIDEKIRKIVIKFNPNNISKDFADWKSDLINTNNIEYNNDYIPYCGFDDIYRKAGIKLGNCFYVIADEKVNNGIHYYKYTDIMQLSGFTLERFLASIKSGDILVDFDARTGHNHGTKFRIKQNAIPLLYENIKNF